VHVESVAWITERKNVLSAFFYLLAALAYLRFEERRDVPADRTPGATGTRGATEAPGAPGRRAAWTWYAAAVLFFILALFAKSVTCSLPAAMILVFLWQRRPLHASRLLPLVPFFAIGLALAMHTSHLERTNVGASGPDFAFSVLDRCLIASRALLFYPMKLLVPWPLVFIYPRWSIDDAQLRHYWSIGAVAVVSAGALWLYLRGRRGGPLALAYYAGAIVPALGFFNVYPMIYSFVADHFQYLASLGVIALIVGSVAPRFAARLPQAAAPVAAAVLTALGAVTWVQGHQYRDEASLWRTTLERNPGAWIAHNNLGLILRREGRIDEAIDHFRQAIALKWDHHRAHANLAESYRSLGRLEEALAEWMIALEYAPPLHRDLFRVGRILDELGRAEEAMAWYRRAIENYPNRIDARFRLAGMLAERGELDEAAAHFRVVAQLDDTNHIAHGFLADHAMQARDWAAALRHYEAVLDWTDDAAHRVRAMDRWAWIRATCPVDALRDGRAAAEIAGQAAELTGRRVPKVLLTLAAACAECGRFDDAARLADEAATVAESLGNADLRSQADEHRRAYLAGRPWRDG
jgi:tetratricopeptide (TPR) repeat protein